MTESTDRETLRKLARILTGTDVPSELGLLTITASAYVARCKALVDERDRLLVELRYYRDQQQCN
ncbi:TPA: hypothetical protein ACQ8UR_004513 [Escherichia coli]